MELVFFPTKSSSTVNCKFKNLLIKVYFLSLVKKCYNYYYYYYYCYCYYYYYYIIIIIIIIIIVIIIIIYLLKL